MFECPFEWLLRVLWCKPHIWVCCWCSQSLIWLWKGNGFPRVRWKLPQFHASVHLKFHQSTFSMMTHTWQCSLLQICTLKKTWSLKVDSHLWLNLPKVCYCTTFNGFLVHINDVILRKHSWLSGKSPRQGRGFAQILDGIKLGA